MKYHCLNLLKISLSVVITLFAVTFCHGQESGVIQIRKSANVPGLTQPIPVSLEGFSGEVASVLRFDLYVQGFSFVSPDVAKYQISGSNSGNVSGTVTFAQKEILSRSYTGADLRAQAHAFANDIVQAITGKPGISLMRGSTARIAFKVQRPDGTGEIYVSDFDGHNAQAVTHDDAIVAKPAWIPGRLALFYTSYKLGNPDIFYHDLSTGQRRLIAGFSGLNTSAAVSPNGTKVAMILSKSGSPEVWVCNADGTHFQQLTTIAEGASSPCWSPDSRWICFATKIHGRRRLAKVPSGGGEVVPISTAGAPNPSEPAWSPDGKWIAFTCQTSEFDICVVPANGSTPPTVLVEGTDPSWSPNSRTLVFTRHTAGYHEVVSVLDVFTKQFKDVPSVPGNDSEPAWEE